MKPFFVVCVDDSTFYVKPYPKKGDIEKVIDAAIFRGVEFYRLDGYDYKMANGKIVAFAAECFRPVDESFGEWVESTIMKEVELEHALIEQ
jgi:hypothetical protein